MGQAISKDYRKTYFMAHPELQGKVVIHHAVPQYILKAYPNEVSEAEMHSLENLRGIPKKINVDLHLREIGKEWRMFYDEYPEATRQQILQHATEVDKKYGMQFLPPIDTRQ